MRHCLVAVSLMWVMGTASAQDIAACTQATGKGAGVAAQANPLQHALQASRVGDGALGVPVAGECERVADGRKASRSSRRTAAAASGAKRDPDYYRFDMSQNGKKMSAEDFDRWMKARGIRVAKGPQPKPVARTERKRRR
jgi:hypothetical protein